MSIDMLRDAFLWCAVINYGVLLVWFLFFILARDFMQRLHGRWFQLSRQQFDIIHYGGMGLFKLGIILFNLVPYIALRIVG
jgi:phosphatidylglycerophosphate synthase